MSTRARLIPICIPAQVYCGMSHLTVSTAVWRSDSIFRLRRSGRQWLCRIYLSRYESFTAWVHRKHLRQLSRPRPASAPRA